MYTAEFNRLKKTDSIETMNAKLKAISLEFHEVGPMMIDEYTTLLNQVHRLIDNELFTVKELIFDKHKNVYTDIDTFSKHADEILLFNMTIVRR